MTLTDAEMTELARILDARDARRSAEELSLRKIAQDPVKRRKQFKIVPGAALSPEAARLARFYEKALPEQRAAFNALMSVFAA